MKIMVALLMTASLMACGSKAKKSTTPDNKTGTTETKTEGTGGTTYGGQTAPTPPSSGGADPCAGQ